MGQVLQGEGAPSDAAPAPSILDDLEPLLREIVDRVSDPDARRPPDEAGERVLADLQVEDVRCLVIRSPRRGPRIHLSPREREIARMVAEGHPNKRIAAVLDISSWTVGTHLRRIFAKLGVSSRAAMVARLLRDDLLPPSPLSRPVR
jgi:DNA-binding CsgD family transcriptional regulator